MKKEIFKTIPGYEDYQISNLGRVKSLKFGIEKILNPSLDKKGYLKVKFQKDGKLNTFKVHQLVAVVFLDHKPNGMESVIDHINSDKIDNRVDNLRIVSNRENSSKINERKNKTSKYTGIYFHKGTNKWLSRIQIDGSNKYLGLFLTEEEAYQAYLNALNSI